MILPLFANSFYKGKSPQNVPERKLLFNRGHRETGHLIHLENWNNETRLRSVQRSILTHIMEKLVQLERELPESFT